MLYRALSLAVFSALLLTGQISNAQTFSISPEHKIDLTAAPGELTTEFLSFTNHSDKPVTVAASYEADETIGIDLPKSIVLAPNEQFDVIISFLGIDGSAHGEITLTSGDEKWMVEVRGNVVDKSEGGEGSSASVYAEGNREIKLAVGPNPVVKELNVNVLNAASAKILINDLSGKLITSAKSTSLTWDAAANHLSGTYFVTVRGVTTSGKPFNETRKVSVQR